VSSKRRRNKPRAAVDTGFWGPSVTPAVIPAKVTPSPDPGVLPRSLGDPPLALSPAIAQHHLSAVYEEAVRAATALAAANGLLDLDPVE
jgi:hypothetical protein